MSEPEDELTPLPDDPEEPAKPSRSPFIGLGVAAIVVSTVFATVAALASTRDEAAPAPQSKDNTIETSSPETYTTDPTETSAPGSSTTKAPKKSGSSSATTSSSGDDETTSDGEGTTTGGGDTTTQPGHTTTRPTGTTTTQPNRSPVADFNFTCNGLKCDFNGGSSADPDGSIASFSWSFGATGSTASHTFDQAGSFDVTLTVKDNKGKGNAVTKSVTVTAPTTTSGN
jgi:hypothetical protein